MNSPPMANSQSSGKDSENSVLPQLTTSVPTTAPTIECRPPTAQKITISNLRCFERAELTLNHPDGGKAEGPLRNVNLLLGLNGAEIVFNPSATVAGLSEYLWELEQPAHAAANGYFVAASNRVGIEKPWQIGEFYGKSYFCNPRGKIIAQASRDKDELLVADLNLDEMKEVRETWQFFRDRRPETYGEITRSLSDGKAQAAD